MDIEFCEVDKTAEILSLRVGCTDALLSQGGNINIDAAIGQIYSTISLYVAL